MSVPPCFYHPICARYVIFLSPLSCHVSGRPHNGATYRDSVPIACLLTCCGTCSFTCMSVLFSVPEGRKIVLGKYNCPSTGMNTQCILTLFSVHEEWTVEILLHFFRPWGTSVNIILWYFLSLRYLTFTRGRKQYAHYKTPAKKMWT